MDKKGMLSVVIPAYNEYPMIMKAAHTIHSILDDARIQHEILFVNDGSKDETWTEVLAASRELNCVRGISFSRNFGKESAIYAGLSYARGDCAVVIDCDLQHPPEKIAEMYQLWNNKGVEIVEAVKRSRGNESRMHSFAAVMFYSIISWATGIDMSKASDYKLLDRKAINVLLNIREQNAFFRALSSWIGFKTAQIEFDVQERTEGESKWSTFSLIKYALTNIASFSSAPMQIVTALGMVMLLFSIVLGVTALVQKFRHVALEGFTTIIIIQLFSSSIIMISLGIIGFYIAKIYDEVKARPRFIVSETCGEINE